MPDALAKALADCKCGLVVAPAGCGKTRLISETVQYCNGRQLVLTHTHAGVRAIRDRMARLNVPQDQYRVCTLHAFALKYAAAFPTLSGWAILEPESDEQWEQLLPAATSILNTKVVDAVLRASYTGMFVDEYQDCSTTQHELVVALSSVLPCRVFGDPLQAIYRQIHKEKALPWPQVEKTFPVFEKLQHPHRWTKKNEALGRWLLEIHDVLLNGGGIDLDGVSCLKFRECDPQAEALGECLRKCNIRDQTVVALRAMREECHFLAGKLRNTFTVFEDAHGEELMKWAVKIEEAQGVGRVEMLLAFADKWLTCLPPKTTLRPIVAAIVEGKPQKARRPDLLHLANTLERIREGGDLNAIPDVLDAFLALKKRPMFKSKEIWSGLRRAAENCAPSSGVSLRESAGQHREFIRRNGRQPPRRCLSTPLLVKGLEFDHSLILNAADFPDAESLYVCLTRASRSVTILAKSSRFAVRKPAS